MPTVPNRYLNPDHRIKSPHPGLPPANGGRKPRQSQPAQQQQLRERAIQRAIISVQGALRNQYPTLSGVAAKRLASVILSRPGVKIGAGKRGDIFWKGQRFSPASFAQSNLAKLASGATATAQNQAAIKGSPDYIQALAGLGLQRDQSIAGLQDQQRQALIEYGDPTFAQGDALTAGAAGANPFSTATLQRQAYQNQLSQASQAANRLGVGAGGGAVSGQQQAQRVYAANVQDAVSKLQALLGQVSSQEGQARQAYGMGQSQAALDAYNNLLASGYHAAAAPAWAPGRIRLRQPLPGRKNGGGGGNGVPGFGNTGITQLPGGGGGMQIPPRNGFPGVPPIGTPGHLPPPTLGTQQPLDMTALYRRYGISYG